MATVGRAEGHSRTREYAGGDSYALRQSSIVRGLRKGFLIQQVAKLHNTSVKMIGQHYAKNIATALEDLARAAVVSLVPRSDGNVGPMGKRAETPFRSLTSK
ncbi:DNA-binding NarL/FixJ family response regulator [Bradyrhizobium sp. GM5.1]